MEPSVKTLRFLLFAKIPNFSACRVVEFNVMRLVLSEEVKIFHSPEHGSNRNYHDYSQTLSLCASTLIDDDDDCLK